MATRKPDPVDIEVGQRIKIQRLAAGLSQTELGESIGVTFQQVQKYEKGTNRVGAGRLTKIAQVFGIPVSAFFGTQDAANIDQSGRGLSPLKFLTVPGALRLARAYGQLNESMRLCVVDLVERIAARRR